MEFSQLNDSIYYWSIRGDKFETFDDAKKMQQKFKLYDSFVMEVEK